MAEQERPNTDGVLWDAVRAIIAAMKAFLVPDNPATGQDLVDTGSTAREMLPGAHFATVYAKPMGRELVDTFIRRQ